MKCVSCETEINPQWTHAININVCPYCGKMILEEHLKNCISALASAMSDMQQYQEQLDDWLLSNYNYIKTDSPQLPQYCPKQCRDTKKVEENSGPTTVKIKVPGGGEQEIVIESKLSQEKTDVFFDRAEVLKGSGKTSGKGKGPNDPEQPKSVVDKTQHLKAIARQIKQDLAQGTQQGIITQANLAAMIDPEVSGMTETVDPEAVAEVQKMIASGEDLVSSGLQPVATGEDDDIPRVVLQMASQKKTVANSNDKDMQTLREMQNKVADNHKKLGTGGFGRA